jgi:hypothetical protein
MVNITAKIVQNNVTAESSVNNISAITDQKETNVSAVSLPNNVSAKIASNNVLAKFSNLVIPHEANLSLSAETSDATPTEMLNGTSRISIDAGEYWFFDIKIIASDETESTTLIFEGGIKRTLAGTVTLIGDEVNKERPTRDNAPDWNVLVTADDTNKALKIEAIGENGKDIKWVGRIFITKIVF